ncbi:cation:proton antiporter [Congregibacter litoralis]|uniref:Transporter, CPA2 family n=1 Tax=Congregibacter litoralis KT71 TaxID=314285 RepID=A4A4U5_9GAMM|nr:cation:proton antiporter [Congregibacter litoralis]EAQ98816.2 transporter, CPA2 family [Congregibacter litoralis KT71]
MDSLFFNVGLILGLAACGGFIARSLNQPLIVAFIAVGIALGPSALGIVVPSNEIELFARLGIALLLFVVGLRLDLHVIRSVGPVALASGLGQVAFTTAIGFGLSLALGMSTTVALYVAVALTFSSTIIIVKLLSDKRELETLHGRIAIGFLIVQDIVVVLVMIALTAFGGMSSGDTLLQEALAVVVKGALMLLAVLALMRYVLPLILPRLATSSELLMLFSIALAVLGGAAGVALGFSKEVGAFLAGICLASTPYREQIAARLVSLRDFLLLFFFIELGATIDLLHLGAQLPSAILLSLFVLIGNPLIVMGIMGVMGYRRRTGFHAGLTVAQISEFSLVLAALGLGLGHLTEETVGLIALVGLITISASTYMILYSQPLYAVLATHLKFFERQDPFRERIEGGEQVASPDIIVVGLGRYGQVIADGLHQQGHKILAVDLDPAKVTLVESSNVDVAYGDASDAEFLSTLPLNEAEWLIFTVRDAGLIKMAIESLRQVGHECGLIIAAPDRESSAWLRQHNVDLILMPYRDAADSALRQLSTVLPQRESQA